MEVTLDFLAYEKYLEYMDSKIEKFFEQAKPYVFCKEGCSHCCQKGQYPYSHLEFRYLLYGSLNLSKEQMLLIDKNVEDVKKLQKENTDDRFFYRCPFLIDDKCSVYKYRGLICRSHGLAFYIDKAQNYKIPGCVDYGLNYSNVVDLNQKLVSKEMFDKLGIEEEPVAYNLSLKYLLNNDATKALNLEFGKNKPLIDWFVE